MADLLRWIIPVFFAFVLLLFVFVLFPRILAKLLPAGVKHLHPIKKFLLGSAIVLTTVALISALCFIVAMAVWAVK
ncbi:hypothetical protein LJC34_05355 [Oscillospiraceae bacterium OttesenSCG-928-G22]|nr:hypothetical protein [Oscillospiraceae bacterium OttesenSCG-928-G22]